MLLTLVIMASAWGRVYSQSSGTQIEGSHISAKQLVGVDTLIIFKHGDTTIYKSVGAGDMKINPHTATMFAAVVPGLGQIYNRKYWKVPLVYGAIFGLYKCIDFNNGYYNEYRRAYRDFIAKDPNNKAYISVQKRTNLTLEECEGQYADWFKRVLENKKNYYRRYRDLSIFGMVGVYVVQLVDACVDAHFHDFDVTEDLALHWSPMIIPDEGGPMLGATVAITF